MLRDLLCRWSLIRQLQTGADGTGTEAMSANTRNLRPKTLGAQVTPSICPYCGVVCGQLIFHKDSKLIAIEGDPKSPISRGHLCPKGADTLELHTHPGRLKKVKYRRPYSRSLEEIDLEIAMDMVPTDCGTAASARSRKAKTATLSCRRLPLLISGERPSITKRIISSKNCSPQAWV